MHRSIVRIKRPIGLPVSSPPSLIPSFLTLPNVCCSRSVSASTSTARDHAVAKAKTKRRIIPPAFPPAAAAATAGTEAESNAATTDTAKTAGIATTTKQTEPTQLNKLPLEERLRRTLWGKNPPKPEGPQIPTPVEAGDGPRSKTAVGSLTQAKRVEELDGYVPEVDGRGLNVVGLGPVEREYKIER